MSGTDDRSPGSIEQLALSWGLSPEQARKVAATAAALAAGALPLDEHLPRQRGTAARIPVQRHSSASGDADEEATAAEPRQVGN
ncbi:hypothetical protein [Pseudonocardia kunmingensis]|uniref:hypothetical protein n=1 Tax=Pseudonocardia kunmingensis TaxID=630975 RepID=UPI001478C6CD|nr:hypothetical protein [Pseudonocardia kunmingensis]